MANQEISKNSSNILMEKQLLRLIYYYCLAFSLLTPSYIQKNYFLLFCCYLSYYDQNYFISVIIYFISVINPQTSWCHRIIAALFQQIIHWHNNIKTFCIVYKCVIDFWYAWSKWSIIFEDELFISCFSIIISFNGYCPFYNNTWI